LKEWACVGGGRVEVEIEGKVADGIDGEGNIVEVQTGKFGTLRSKISAWTASGHRVRIIHPIASRTTLLLLDPTTGETISRRKSPKHETFWDIFSDLVHYPELIANGNIRLELPIIEKIERRISLPEPRRSGRYMKTTRTVDRELEVITDVRILSGPQEWIDLIPTCTPQPFDTTGLAVSLGIAEVLARKMLYCYNRAGLIHPCGKEGKRIVYILDRESRK
jgi:hypothetical protein